MLVFKSKVVNDQNYTVINKIEKTKNPQKGDFICY